MSLSNRFNQQLLFGALLFLVLGLSGCSCLRSADNAPNGKLDPNNIPDAVPRTEPLSKYGNPKSYVVHGKRYYVLQNAKGYDKTGLASWYGTKFHGQHTSSRESYNMYSMTAASPVLPIPTYVKVTNLRNGRTAIVKVNDRGPFRSDRLIDLSYAAAVKLGYANKGTTQVRVTVIDATAPSSSLIFAQNSVTPPASRPLSATKETNVALATGTQKVDYKKPIKLASAENTSSPLYVQVGSYKSLVSAKNMTKKIKQLSKINHTQVAIKETNQGDSPVYRVHIGPLKNNDQSQQIVQLLTKNGFQKPLVVAG